MLNLHIARIVLAASLSSFAGASASTAVTRADIDATNQLAPAAMADTEDAPAHAMTRSPNWVALDDPALPVLIERALQANTDVRQAMARLEIARARQQATGANALPEDELAYRRESGDAAAAPYAASFAWSWEVDLFGRLKSAREGARARRQASANELEGVRVMVVAL